jgi:peptidoglycan-associated lipoprotein
MRTTTMLRPIVVSAAALLALGACRRTQPVPPVAAAAPSPAADADADRLARERAAADSLARVRAEAERESAARAAEAAALAEARRVLTAPVYFGFDLSDITTEGQAVLDAKLALLQRHPALTLRIAGHTDSRGAVEYNLALGLRRANAAKKYLTDRGIDGGRLAVVSFGAERPVAQGDGEESWAQNRRDEFEITAGESSLGRSR